MSAVNVGLIISTTTANVVREVAAVSGRDFNEAFAEAVVLKISEFGGVAGIRAKHAPGRSMKLLVIREGTEPAEPIHVLLR